jgi:hypothetical protein
MERKTLVSFVVNCFGLAGLNFLFNLLAAVFKYPQSTFTCHIFLRQPFKFFHTVYKKPLYYVNQTRLNNELRGILWEIRQRYFCMSSRKQQVFLFRKYTK